MMLAVWAYGEWVSGGDVRGGGTCPFRFEQTAFIAVADAKAKFLIFHGGNVSS